MKKIIKTTERNWQCPYCGFLNDLSKNTCEKCSAIRNGNEVEKEITTNFEETTTIETHEGSDIVISTRNSLKVILSLSCAFAIIIVLCLIANKFTSTNSSPQNNNLSYENYTVISKDWEYTISIGEFVNVTDIKSTTAPPKGATNIKTHQVQQENGWYKTEYTYDFADWKVTRTETITGSDSIPTFKEYTALTEDEKIISTSVPRYTVTVNTSSGKQVIRVSESKWITFVKEKTYPASEF